MAQKPLTLKRWRRVEYERLVDLGAFEQEPLELLGGQLIVAEPKGSEHATAVDMADDALRAALPGGWIVRVQNPLALDDESAPEPDIAVVRGARSDFRYTHPARPALIIEVAESSLGFDRVAKGSLYARAGIVDYWIVNLMDRVPEATATPAPMSPPPTAGAIFRSSGSHHQHSCRPSVCRRRQFPSPPCCRGPVRNPSPAAAPAGARRS